MDTNAPDHQRVLAKSSAEAVVRPNADTPYIVLIYDLSAATSSSRYGDNYANIGSVYASPARQYLLRIVSEANAQPGLQIANGCGDHLGYVDSATTYGILLPRILVHGGGVVPALNRNQGATASRLLLPSPPGTHAPPLTIATLTSDLSNDALEATLQLTAPLARWNLPEVPSDQQRVACNLLAAGISNGTYTQPPGVSLAHGPCSTGREDRAAWHERGLGKRLTGTGFRAVRGRWDEI